MTPPTGAARLTEELVERRDRRPVTMSGYAERADGSRAEVTVLDLAYEGCGIECSAELTAGEPLRLSVLRRGEISCHVRWYANGRAGLVFDAEPEATERQQRERSSARTALDGEVSLRRIGNVSYRVQLFDLSPDGCKVELVERPRAGEQVLVKMPQLETLEAEVVWVEEFTAGLRFGKPVHPAVFDLLVERLKA